MNAKPFLDTNVLIYAFTKNDPRSLRAEALLTAGGIVSVQVLNEFVNVSRRKLGRGWTEIVNALSVLQIVLDPPVPVTFALHQAAVDIARRRGLSFYDSLIISAAASEKCTVLYSEDMQAGQTVEGVTIQNPFTP